MDTVELARLQEELRGLFDEFRPMYRKIESAMKLQYISKKKYNELYGEYSDLYEDAIKAWFANLTWDQQVYIASVPSNYFMEDYLTEEQKLVLVLIGD